MRELREDQERAKYLLRKSLSTGHKRPMLMAPTAFGKTILAADIVKSAREKGKRVIFCVPAISLIDQTVQKFQEHGIFEIGVLQGNHPMTDYSKPVQIASVQTLARRRIPHADLVVIDEAHVIYQSVVKWMEQWNAIPFIGLSATPWSKGLGKYYDDLLIGGTTAELIEKGVLSKFEVFAPSHPDLSGVKIRAGDYAEDQLSEVMRDSKLVSDIVQNWLEHGEGKPTLCFCVDRAHAQMVRDKFVSAGVECGYIDAFTDMDERQRQFEAFQAKTLPVICNVGCLTTGVDLDVRCIILGRPTRSTILYVQIIGRGLRTAEGKESCTIFDHTDTTLRLGFVSDIHQDKLDDGKPKQSSSERKQPLPKECPKCHFLKPPRTRKCPVCAFESKVVSDIEEADGSLEKISGGQKKVFSMEDKQEYYSGLLYYAQKKGFKEGWASNMFKSKFGTWPRKLGKVATPPTQRVDAYIKHKQIKYFKSKQKVTENANSRVSERAMV